MSKLDKEKVLAEYEAAYQKAHGKKPKIESKSGWYSVDGGKNVRLAQLAEEAKTLAGGKSTSKAKADSAAEKKPAAKKTAAKKTETKKAPAKKAAAKKPAAKKAAKPAKAKTVSSGNGLTAKELWKQKLEQNATECRLPRGSF